MDVANLEKVLKLCRKYGITEFSEGDVKLVFGEVPQKKRAPRPITEQERAILAAPIPGQQYSAEQILEWSTGSPEGVI